MEDCIFCKLIKGDLPCEIIAQNDEFVAILGIFPKFPGMTSIVVKEHKASYLYESLSDEELSRMHVFAKSVALILNKALGSYRTIQVMEGFEIPHAHIKLFPVYQDQKYDCSFEGKVQASPEELKKIAEKIRKVVS